MNYVKTRSLLAALFFYLVPSAALANMSYSPWVHEIVQNGADVEITVSIFDETTWTNHEDETLPGLEAVYSLKRWGFSDDIEFVFENRVFDPEEADEVTDYICHSWYSDIPDIYDTECGEDDCADCDGDGAGDCVGFCGVAYRYKVVDTCPPPEDSVYYEMSTTPPYHLNTAEEGLGFTTSGGVQDIGAECQEEKGTGCSAALVNAPPQNRSLLTALLFLCCVEGSGADI